jgi:hypothetical protein
MLAIAPMVYPIKKNSMFLVFSFPVITPGLAAAGAMVCEFPFYVIAVTPWYKIDGTMTETTF